MEFLKICHQEMHKYGVTMLNKKIIHAHKKEKTHFVVTDEDGQLHYAKKLLVATGLLDNLPHIEGFKELYGISVFHCPYCDGWEVRDKILGVYARNKEGAELALALKGWSNQVTLYTDGKEKVTKEHWRKLEANNIPVVKHTFEKLQSKDGVLEKIIFKNGEEHPCDAIFFVNGFTQQCNLMEVFGCDVNKKGVVITNHLQQTNTPGLYVAGDASRDMHFVVVAAAEGAKAGVSINKELQKEVTEVHLQLVNN
jgi:thioredoxin reductase